MSTCLNIGAGYWNLSETTIGQLVANGVSQGVAPAVGWFERP